MINSKFEIGSCNSGNITTMNDRDEILIQKCVDNEATPDERHELMQNLDQSTEGWKELACSFMEDQLFSAATIREASHSVGQQKPEPQKPKRHWFAHPVVSLTLSVCVAFMAGLLVRGQNSVGMTTGGGDGNDQALADNSGSSPEAAAGPAPEAGFVANDGEHRVQFMENGVAKAEVPIYRADEYAAKSQEYYRRMSRTGGSRSPSTRTIWLKTEDGAIYVIPVEEHLFQVFQ